MLIGWLLLYALHAVLHIFLVAPDIFLFEKRDVKFAESHGKIQPEQLRVPSPHRMLGKVGGLGINVASSCPQDVIHTKRQGSNFIFKEFIPHCCVYSISRFGISLCIAAYGRPETAAATPAA